MSILSSFIECPNLQVEINAAFPVCVNPEPTPFLNFLVSSENTEGVLQKSISPGEGKLRTVEVRYSQRITEDQITETISDHNCTATTKRGDTITVYDLDETDGVLVEELIDFQDLWRKCQSSNTWLLNRIAAMLDVYQRKLATKMVSQATLLTGQFADGDNDVVADVKTVQTRKANGDIDKDLLTEVEFSAINAGFCGPLFGFGYGEFTKFFRELNAGCCSNQGLDMGALARQFGISVASDRRIVSVADGFGTDNFILVQSGALQMLTWVEYSDPAARIDDDQFKQMTIIHPTLGTPVDFLMKHDCGKVHLIIKSAAKLVGLPTDWYAAGDIFEGVTGVLQFDIVNP